MDGRFGGRDDLGGVAQWEVRGFGLGEVAARRQGRIQVESAEIQLGRVINDVMAEVASAEKSADSANDRSPRPNARSRRPVGPPNSTGARIQEGRDFPSKCCNRSKPLRKLARNTSTP